MKALFWVIALFALAVGLVVAARYNEGFVLVVLPPYRVEVSLNLLFVLLAAGFVVLYTFVRLVTTAVQTPSRVRQYRLARRRDRAQEALTALQGLPRKHTAVLKLELRAQQQTKHWAEVVALVGDLERRKVFDAEHAAKLRTHATVESLRRKGIDAEALDEEWKKVPDAEKRETSLAAAAAQCYIALGRGSDAQQIIEQSLEERWDSGLASLYGDVMGADPVTQMDRAEKWLEREPHDAALLLTLGKLCARQGLWEKAQSFLEASIAVEPTYAAHLELARLEEKLGNIDAARRRYRDSLDLALAALKTES